MKKKIINGLLFAVALVAATSSFVSCKDYEGDNYAELNSKYKTLQDAFDAQVTAMKDYVLLTESGWTRNELATKTIKDRLAELKAEMKSDDNLLKEYLLNQMEIEKANAINAANGYTDGKIGELDGKIGELDGKISDLNTQLQELKNVWGPKLDKAYEQALEVEAHSADWNTTTSEWNAVKDLIAKMIENYNKDDGGWSAGEGGSGEGGSGEGGSGEVIKFATIQDIIDYFYNADQAYSQEIAELQKKIEARLNTLESAYMSNVTGVEIQAVENPIFGSFAYPIGLESNVLAAYYGQFESQVTFPAGDLDDVWANETAPVTNAELDAIGAPAETFGTGEKGLEMLEGDDNAGKVYMTVNPSPIEDFDSKAFTLRTSTNRVSKFSLVNIKPSTKELVQGYQANRAASPNGFYEASAKITKDNVTDVALSFNMSTSDLANTVKDMMSNWAQTSVTDWAKLAYTVAQGMKTKEPVPSLGVQVQWKDPVAGWKNVVSGYDIAAVSIKPLSYAFLYKTGFSEGIEKIRNSVFAREKAFAASLKKLLNITLNLPASGGDIVVENDRIWLVLDGNTAPNVPQTQSSVTIPANAFGYGVPVSDVTLTISNKVDITELYTAIQTSVNKAVAPVGTKINDILNKVISVEDKFFGKAIAVAKNPNRYLQPALIGYSNDFGYFYPSRFVDAPTEVAQGTEIVFHPTSLTGEILAPAYKKYIAVTGVWEFDPATSYNPTKVLPYDASWNTYPMNTVVDGPKYTLNNDGFKYKFNQPKGTVVEIVYECLDYHGKVAGKKYYFTVF